MKRCVRVSLPATGRNADVRKPRLTARIVRGLGSVYALADVNMFDDSDLYAGSCCLPDGAEKNRAKKEVDDAVAWLGELIDWHRGKEKKHAAKV